MCVALHYKKPCVSEVEQLLDPVESGKWRVDIVTMHIINIPFFVIESWQKLCSAGISF